MPKTIDVKLVGLTGDFSGPVVTSGIAVQGRLFGVTFEEVPDEERDIFTFPAGPITLQHQRPVPIGNVTSFNLRNPSQDPPGSFAMSLRFGGTLTAPSTGDRFGQRFQTINTFTHTQPDIEFPHVVRFISGNQEVRVDFVLKVGSSF
jgi:hypothetical protein